MLYMKSQVGLAERLCHQIEYLLVEEITFERDKTEVEKRVKKLRFLFDMDKLRQESINVNEDRRKKLKEILR